MEFNNSIEIGCYILWTILLLVIVLLNAKGKIHYGWGLGDILMDIFVFVVVLFVDTYTLLKMNNRVGDDYEIFIHVGAFLFLIYMFLKMTIWRGGLSPWDGRIFFK